MSNNNQNLESIVSRIKEQGINAGEEEKQRIIKDANNKAEQIIADATKKADEIVSVAEANANQVKNNAQAAINQASRDMVEATKTSVLKYMQSVFGKECEKLFTTKEYLENLLKVALESIPGNKSVEVPEALVKDMESYILKQAVSEDTEIKPLASSDAKIVITTTENEGLNFVLSADDLEKALFSLLNKELVESIIKNNSPS